MSPDDGPSGPLCGMKVIDMTHVWSGPTCTMILGDLGAEVIKIESFSGDQYRQPLGGSFFVNFNRNKRSIALNLKKEEGKEVVLKLARQGDVWVENFLPGALDRLGLGYEAIRSLNSQIVYCSISGFGQDGPYRERPAYDPILQAMSGLMMATGEPDRPPVRILPAMIDHCTATYAAVGILAALLDRRNTGSGKKIDIALLDVALTAMAGYVTHYDRTGQSPQRYGSGHPASVPLQAFETLDGYLYISVVTEEMWKNFCKVLGLEYLAADPRFATNDGRLHHRQELIEFLIPVIKKYDSQGLEAKLLAVGVPCGKLQNIGEIIQEDHVVSRQILKTLDYPPLGKVLTVESPLFFSEGHPSARLRPPMLGEHTREILNELGYSAEKIKELIREGVASSPKQ
jgi:crotonobetainyl-CoA:carnitine CoA-transferase CaiB-like acyl-CoA transferase